MVLSKDWLFLLTAFLSKEAARLCIQQATSFRALVSLVLSNRYPSPLRITLGKHLSV
jgi:hypothetical protein